MNLNKTTLSISLATILSTGASTTQATIVDMDFSGLFTFLNSSGSALSNTSKPYYYDTTWGYGFRTQITGTLQIDTQTSIGSATVTPFAFLNAGNLVISDFELKKVSNNLLIGNFDFNWNGSDVTSQIVLDASGLFAELANAPTVGDVYDADTCAASSACTTPATNELTVAKTQFPIGLTPVASTTFNTIGQSGFNTTLNQISLGSDDGIGGSPMDNGPFSGFYNNFDMTTLTVTKVEEIVTIPIPAAVWLFGSGLIMLIGLSRRRKNRI